MEFSEFPTSGFGSLGCILTGQMDPISISLENLANGEYKVDTRDKGTHPSLCNPQTRFVSLFPICLPIRPQPLLKI